jgi:arginase family enzyme
VLGGVAPFAASPDRYPEDVAVVWLDAHPDISTPASEYPGFHSMALAALTGHGDPAVLALLPATVPADLSTTNQVRTVPADLSTPDVVGLSG